jgi:RNA polymerase sigma-70 factor (ECF subfamily)
MPNKHLQLKAFIENHREALLNTMGFYLIRAGLATPPNRLSEAQELLHEVVIEALEHADRFDSTRSPQAWLLGIAANLIKRKQAALAKRMRREPLVHDLVTDENLSEDDVFDLVTAVNIENDPARKFELQEQVRLLLEGVSESDRDIIHLAILYDMNGDSLAETLGVSAGAARVRLHRALNRVRTNWQASVEGERYA